jgi:long-chain fatty acid transport protein
MLLFHHIFVTDGIRERTMKLNKIYTAVLFSTLPASTLYAAGLDRSGQSISAFLQPGNYAEAGISVVDADVGSSKLAVDDMSDSYNYVNAAVKVQATDKISLGLIYDQPFGADSTYAATGLFAQNGEGTSVEVKTNNITALIGYQPTENWNVYAGPVWQTVEAKIALRGAAYGNSGYNVKVKEEEAYGWLAGVAYQIPEIALKASLTYRSEISHDAKSDESLGLGALQSPLSPDVNATTPQSVNLDFQTGVAANTIAFANVRWVQWSEFAVTPKFLQLVTNGSNLIDYSDDQWSANVGVGRKFNDKWSGSALVSYDSGAGNPVTTLGPTEGYWGVGLGAQYSPAENYFIQGGVRYMWLGDATAKAGANILDEFTDNHAIGYGMKIGYRF